MPLSTFTYIKRNVKKIIAISSSIALAILFLYILSITISTINRSQISIELKPTEQYSIVNENSEDGIADDHIQLIKEHHSTEHVIGIRGLQTYYTHIMGGSIGTFIWQLPEQDVELFINKLQLQLKEGRLPKPGAQELVVHELLLQNKGLSLGDYIGNRIDATETIPGSYEIVGVLTGDSITGFGTLEPIVDDQLLMKNMLMVFHKNGEREVSNLFLKQLLPPETQLITYNRMKEMIEDNNQELYTTLNITLFVAIFVLSVTTANTTYLHFFERKKEYALLRALGFSGNWVLGKAFREIAVTSLIGLCVGFVITGISLIAFTQFVLIPIGALYQLVDIRAVLNSVTIVGASIMACLIPVWLFLSKIDVITTIEGGE